VLKVEGCFKNTPQMIGELKTFLVLVSTVFPLPTSCLTSSQSLANIKASPSSKKQIPKNINSYNEFKV